jgi:DNA-binding SARP family transcriptional activator
VDVLVLGPLQVWDAGEEITPGGVKLLAVLAMLVLNVNRVVSLESLANGLWGEAAPASAASTLHVYLSRLRTRLHHGSAGEVIRRRRPGYTLELDEDRIDLFRFQTLAGEGKRLLSKDPVAAAAALREALALWRGQPLAEFMAMPFAQTESSRMDERWITAMIARIDADMALGGHAELIGEIESLVPRYPWDERLHERLILSLYRSGRQAEALAACQSTKRAFADELGIDPGRGLQDLEAAILAQDPGLDHVPPPPPVEIPALGISQDTATVSPTIMVTEQPAMGRIFHAPARNPHFAGRSDLLDQLHRRVRAAAPDTPVVQTLYGLGGVGKSHLAIEYAHRFADAYDVVWWVDADQPALIPDQLITLAGRLGLASAPVASETVARVLAALSGRRTLVILDNADQPDTIARYLPTGTGHALVTSRSPAWGALGGRIEVDVLARADTITLLRRRIPVIPTEVADQLSGELGDLPLAAAQAAAYLEQTGIDPADYLHRFRDRRAGLLARGDVFGYQGRIDTTWELSFERLRSSDPAAVALLDLAAFLAPEPIPMSLLSRNPGLLPEPLRTKVTADPDALDDAIGAAVGYSLARRQSGGGFQLHRLVQTVIRHRLSPADRRTMTDTVATMLADAYPGDPNDLTHWAQYTAVAPHVLAAGHLLDDNPAGRTFLLATVNYINARGDTRASRVIAEDLHRRWRNLLGENHPDTLAAAAHLTSTLAWLAEHGQARDLGQDTLWRARKVLGPDHPVTLRLATHLTFALAWLGDTGPACELGEDSLRRARDVLGPDSPDTLRLAANLTLALAWHGDADRARAIGHETLQRAHKALGPDHPITLVTDAHLGLTLAWLGESDADRARGRLEHSRRAVGDDHPTTLAWAVHLAFLLGASGQHNQALELSRDAYPRACRALGPDHLITLVCAAVHAGILVMAGEPEDGRALAEQTHERIRIRLGPDHLIALIAAASLSAAMLATAHPDEGMALAEQTLNTATRRLGPIHPITTALQRLTNAPRESPKRLTPGGPATIDHSFQP